MSILGELQKFNQDAIVELFVLDTTLRGGSVFYFHAGTNEFKTNVFWQGQEYQALPMQIDGFEMSGTQFPRPKMSVANISGVFSVMVRQLSDLVGCKVVRKRTLLRYLDDANFSGANLFKNSALVDVNLNGIADDWTVGGNAPSLQRTVVSTPFGGNAQRSLSPSAAISQYIDCIRQDIQGVTPGEPLVLSCYARGSGTAFYTIVQWLNSSGAVISTRFSSAGTLTTTFSQKIHNVGFAPTGAVTARCYMGRLFGNGGETWIEVTRPVAQKLEEFSSEGGNPIANPNEHFPDDIFYITRKTSENKVVIEFELGSSLDLQGVMLPRRQVIAGTCPFIFRSESCGYAGIPVHPLDRCPKNVEGCKLAFGENGDLRFGGFPGAALVDM
jgi:phage-related protein